MAFNGSGVWSYTYNWANDAANGIPITASRMDSQFNDVGNNGFNNCITRDGQGYATANIPFGGFKITGLGAATTSGDALSWGAAGSLTTLTLSGALTYGGVALSNAVTGTGKMVLDTSPTFATSLSVSNTGTGTSRTANRVAVFRSNASGADVSVDFTDNVTHDYSFGGYQGTAYVTTDNNQGVKLAAGATSWASDSDLALKIIDGEAGFGPIQDAGTFLDGVRTVIGRYKNDDEGAKRPFLIAQDWQTLGLSFVAQTGPDGYLILSYTDAVPFIIAALKETRVALTSLSADFESYKAAHP